MTISVAVIIDKQNCFVVEKYGQSYHWLIISFNKLSPLRLLKLKVVHVYQRQWRSLLALRWFSGIE
jgi:hypothetical protein